MVLPVFCVRAMLVGGLLVAAVGLSTVEEGTNQGMLRTEVCKIGKLCRQLASFPGPRHFRSHESCNHEPGNEASF
jgi:hypothetical protein